MPYCQQHSLSGHSLSLSLSDLALSRPVSRVFSLSLDAVHPEGTPWILPRPDPGRIPWTEKPGRLHEIHGITKRRKRLSDLLSLLTAIYIFVYYKAIKWYLCNICVDNDGGVDTKSLPSSCSQRGWKRQETLPSAPMSNKCVHKKWVNAFKWESRE